MDRTRLAPLAAIFGTAGLIFIAGSLLLVTGCSNDEGAPSFVPEAQAGSLAASPDYGWKSKVTTSTDGLPDGTVFEYH